MRRIHAIVSGRVQGVSYRASTASEARRLGGIVGWVRNRPDGTVELEAEGPEDKISALIAWCHDGPPSANVTSVAVDDVAATGNDTMFAVVR